jgi:ornithine cyclodeaminase/alanine dehydrogenase-like protein (mu-crystallin family)
LPMHFQLDSIRVASRTTAGARAFVERLAPQLDCPLQAMDSIAAAVDDADIVVTISSAAEPFIHAGMLKRGSFLCSLGGGHEIAHSVLSEIDRLFVDDIGYALWRGDFKGWVDAGQITRDDLAKRIEGDMGQVALGQLPPRKSDETVMAVIQGMAISDLVIAKAALSRADRDGAGTLVANAKQVAG